MNPLFGKTAIGNTVKGSFRSSGRRTRKINVHRVGIEEKGEEAKKSPERKKSQNLRKKLVPRKRGGLN